MSTGPGRVMRAIVAKLDAQSTDRWIDLYVLALLVYATTEPTRSQEVAVARAVRRLAEQGVLWSQLDPYDGRLRQVRSRRWPPPVRPLRPSTAVIPARVTRPPRPRTGRSIEDLRKDPVLAAKAIANVELALGARGKSALELHLRGMDLDLIAVHLGVYPDAAERSLEQALSIVPRLLL